MANDPHMVVVNINSCKACSLNTYPNYCGSLAYMNVQKSSTKVLFPCKCTPKAFFIFLFFYLFWWWGGGGVIFPPSRVQMVIPFRRFSFFTDAFCEQSNKNQIIDQNNEKSFQSRQTNNQSACMVWGK